MDLFTTLILLAEQDLPKDRIIDGSDLGPDLFGMSKIYRQLKLQQPLQQQSESRRSVFYYRGNLLMAVRHAHYKMHLWTWTTPDTELEKVIGDGFRSACSSSTI